MAAAGGKGGIVLCVLIVQEKKLFFFQRFISDLTKKLGGFNEEIGRL